jgi:hypothetical protein
MKDWIISKVLAIIGKKLSGWTVIVGGVGTILLGLAEVPNLLWPGSIPQLPPMDADSVLKTILAGWVAIGIGHKGNKVIVALTGVAHGSAAAPSNSTTGAGAGSVGNSQAADKLSGPSVSPNS